MFAPTSQTASSSQAASQAVLTSRQLVVKRLREYAASRLCNQREHDACCEKMQRAMEEKFQVVGQESEHSLILDLQLGYESEHSLTLRVRGLLDSSMFS